MPIINLDGLFVDKDKYQIFGGKGKRTYSKLELEIRKGTPVTIEASEINIDNLENVNLLLLKTKDDKYDLNVNIFYSIEFAGSDSQSKVKNKLKKAVLLWLNMNSENPDDPDNLGISFIKSLKNISKLKFWLEDPLPVENNASKNQSACINEVTLELVVVRTIAKPRDPCEEKPDPCEEKPDQYEERPRKPYDDKPHQYEERPRKPYDDKPRRQYDDQTHQH